jgi:hypothetical protein
MSMPSKGSRRIRVGDHDYRWRVRKKPTYHQGLEWSPMCVSIQSCEEGSTSVLIADLRVSRPDNWLAPHQTGLSPSIVRSIIQRARASGWDPLGSRSVLMEYGLIKDSPGT